MQIDHGQLRLGGRFTAGNLALRNDFSTHTRIASFSGSTPYLPLWGDDVPQQLLCDKLHEVYYRFPETEDEYFDCAPAFTPPQGRWSIYGLKLSDAILRKVYHDNAARLLGIEP